MRKWIIYWNLWLSDSLSLGETDIDARRWNVGWFFDPAATFVWAELMTTTPHSWHSSTLICSSTHFIRLLVQKKINKIRQIERRTISSTTATPLKRNLNPNNELKCVHNNNHKSISDFSPFDKTIRFQRKSMLEINNMQWPHRRNNSQNKQTKMIKWRSCEFWVRCNALAQHFWIGRLLEKFQISLVWHLWHAQFDPRIQSGRT